MGKEIHDNTFTPEAIKERLAEIHEQEKEKTFLCKGCLTESTGYIYQDKLCKPCALQLIAYSRKAQNHIDKIRPTQVFKNSEMVSKKNQTIKNYLAIFENNELTKKEFADVANIPIHNARGIVYGYVKSGYLEFSKEKFVGNRIVKVYRIKK